MARFRINKRSADDFHKRFEQAQKDLIKRILFALAEISHEMETEIKEEAPVDVGQYRKSINSEGVKQRKGKATVKIVAGAEYASIIEFGRSANRKPPPMQSLVGWAKRHGLVSLPVTADLDDPQYRGKPWTEDRSTLYLIARAIGRMGSEGKYPMTTVLDRRKRTLKSDLAEHLKPFFKGK